MEKFNYKNAYKHPGLEYVKFLSLGRLFQVF